MCNVLCSVEECDSLDDSDTSEDTREISLIPEALDENKPDDENSEDSRQRF